MSKNLFGLKKQNIILILLASLATILMIGALGTVAYLSTSTNEIVNTFIPGTTDIDITEEINGDIKENVSITNDSTVDAYVRALVLVTWKDSSGNVYKELPVLNTDYSMNYPASDKWALIGNYYYYSDKVIAGSTTEALLTNGKVIGTAPEGYNLSIEIISQAIQAEPSTAVEEAWPDVKVSNGKLVKATQ